MSKRILFVSHEASRSGAPLVLLSVVRFIREHTDAHCRVLFWSGGPLVEAFEELAPCRVMHPDNLSMPRRLWDRVSVRPDDDPPPARATERRIRGAARGIGAAIDERWMREWRACDLVYANSVRSARAVRALTPNAPLLAHIHEPDFTLHHVEHRADVDTMVGGSHPVIAVSDTVESTLVDDFAVAPSRIHLIHPPISLPRRSTPDRADAASLRRSLGISDDAFVVGGAGTTDWRKGTDLFVQTASSLTARRPDIDLHCVWVGADHSPHGRFGDQLRFDAARAGIADRVHFVGEHSDPWPFYELFDVFALTSRAEPFGLVALETASIERPIVCFEGIMPELFGGLDGAVVPYLGIEQMADGLARLYDDPRYRESIGQALAERVRAQSGGDEPVRRIAQLIFNTAR